MPVGLKVSRDFDFLTIPWSLMLRRYPRVTGVALGLAVMTVSLIVLFYTDFGRRLELQTFGFRIRYCNQLQPASPIVHVDIDDGALARVRRWPWHRDEIAQVVRAISELGAKSIMIDFLFNEPEEPYLADPRINKYEQENTATLGELAEANRVYPDLELAAAMRDAGNVILAMHFETPEPPDPKEILRTRIRDVLLTRFTMTDSEVAAELKENPLDISALFARAKSDAALRLVQAMVKDGKPPTANEAFDKILGARKTIANADRTDVEKALFTTRGILAAEKSWPRPANPIESLPTVPGGDPPCPGLAESVAAVAAVDFMPDPDGIVRRLPLIRRLRDRYVVHMGLESAARILDLQLDKVSLSGSGWLTIPSRKGPGISVPLDPEGNMFIYWAATAPEWRIGKDFEHITAAKLYELIDARTKLDQNRIYRDFLVADVVAAAKGEVTVTATSQGSVEAGLPTSIHADSAFRKKINDLLDLQRRIHTSKLGAGGNPAELAAWEKQATQLRQEIAREQDQAITFVKQAGQELAEIPPDELAKDPSVMEQVKRFRPALDIIEKQLPAIDQANRKLEEAAAATRAALAGKIKDKHVFLGFAATAEGDIVPTPIDHRTNGVMCHAHALNGILQIRFIAPASRALEWFVALLLGAAVSFITATRAPRAALLATLGLILGYALIVCYVLFMKFGICFALAAPLITLFITWAFVTLYRQLTAEREKRLFAKQLSQYTAPAIAARIAESPDAVAAFKTVTTREMTFFFSDLAGFTTLSEKENAETIQHVLNTYLDRMSQVIWAHRGLINKFMGDGIMAFFNPSVDPLADHGRIACETSLATLEEMDRLKTEMKTDPAARVFEQLSMRIGLSTGNCKNGDLGSELKADYTAIGDVVNLAARLEPANKVFGTRIMVSGPLRDATKNEYEYRYLAELQVKGKSETVPVYELICRRGQLPDEERQYIERFEAGVDLYKARKWDECIVHFTRILARRFDDLGASRYVDACQEFKRFPPDENWTGALELKEK